MTFTELLDLTLYLTTAFRRSYDVFMAALGNDDFELRKAAGAALDHCKRLNDASKIVTKYL